jgi:hypothetical protein
MKKELTPKPSINRKDWADYQAILKEIEQLARLDAAGLMDRFRTHPEDAFSDLPRPGGGTVPFTRNGDVRFEQIARRGLRTMGAGGKRHHLTDVITALKVKFVSWQTSSLELSAERAHRLFEDAIAEVEAEHTALTHFLPCSLVAHHEPNRFRIGPVTFVLSSLFLSENETRIRQSEARGLQTGLAYEELAKFFSRFTWVASIEIAACAPDVSEKRARRIVQMALDLFKLCIGRARASDVRQGHDHNLPKETATLVLRQPEGFDLSWSRKMFDAVINDAWHLQISQIPFWKSAELVIEEYARNWEDMAEPYERFFDGLTWHGEAVSDPEPQSRLIKFWMAIERIVSLRANDDITCKAALLASKTSSDFAQQSKKVQQLYSRRSSVIHGSARRSRDESVLHAADTEELSRQVISAYLSMLMKLRADGDVSIDRLKAEYEKLRRRSVSARRKP